MIWGRIFRELYAAADDRSRQAARAAIEQPARAPDKPAAPGVPESDPGASSAYRQAVQALAQADALLAPLRLTGTPVPPAVAAAAAELPGAATPHGHDPPTAQTNP